MSFTRTLALALVLALPFACDKKDAPAPAPKPATSAPSSAPSPASIAPAGSASASTSASSSSSAPTPSASASAKPDASPPFDATALVSPISVVVDVVPNPKTPISDCVSSHLAVHLEDAKGLKKSFDHGLVTGGADTKPPSITHVKPTAGEVVVEGVFCAGLLQGYVVKAAGDTLVATETWDDEEFGRGKRDQVIAKFAAGASLKFP